MIPGSGPESLPCLPGLLQTGCDLQRLYGLFHALISPNLVLLRKRSYSVIKIVESSMELNKHNPIVLIHLPPEQYCSVDDSYIHLQNISTC
jgi:hypothetical protein